MWAFAKVWMKGAAVPDSFSSSLIDPTTRHQTTDLKDKARILARQRPRRWSRPRQPKAWKYIRKQELKTDPCGLNSKIIERELKYGMGNLRSNAMRQDKMHNMMLKNLSDDNKKDLLHLLNCMLKTAFLPEDWKRATIIPIRKPEKPAEEPESFRPISIIIPSRNGNGENNQQKNNLDAGEERPKNKNAIRI